MSSLLKKIKTAAIVIPCSLFVMSFMAAMFSARLNAQDVSLGQMDGFWRYTPVYAVYMKTNGAGQVVPPYMYSTAHSFPYQRRINPATNQPYATEYLFADGVFLVRPMGGWNTPTQVAGSGEAGEYINDITQADVLYRDPATGKLAYRWNLLFGRLDPLINDAGYRDITFVFDNIPWCMPTPGTAAVGKYGQKTPAQYTTWWWLAANRMCSQLVSRYGRSVAEQFSFRVGTEWHNEDRFNGTLEQYLRMYDNLALGVRSVLPNANFGPFNAGGQFRGPGAPYSEEDNGYYIAKHCATEVNYADSSVIGSPFNFAGTSYYFGVAIRHGAVVCDPKDGADFRQQYWDSLATDFPQLDNWGGWSGEVHEFSISGSEVPKIVPPVSGDPNVETDEPGARGGAEYFQMITWLRAAGCGRISHWDVAEKISATHYLLNSQGWLYMLFDAYRGGDAFQRTVTASTTNDTRFVSVAMRKSNKLMVLVSAFNARRDLHATHQVSVDLPKEWFASMGTIEANMVKMDRSTFVYDIIRADLATNSLLLPDYAANPDIIADVNAMGGSSGKTYVLNHIADYENKIVDSLKLKPMTPADGSLTDQGTTYRLTIPALPCPGVWAVEFQ